MGKRGSAWGDYLVYWIIGIVFLVLSVIVYLIYSGKLDGIADFISNFLRFGK